MRGYTYHGKMIYLETKQVPPRDAVIVEHYQHSQVPVVHLVCECHWLDYVTKRLQTPNLVVIYGTMQEREIKLSQWRSEV